MPDRPSIVLMMSDQHNPHILGCTGDPLVRTPNLDALAATGVRMSNTYCAHPLCAPSRAAFLTAQYPSDIEVYDNSGHWSSDVPTFAHALGGAGYEAILCGRMHLASNDPFHGFERRIHGDTGSAVSKDILGSGRNRTNGQTRYAVEVAGYGKTGFQAFDRSVTDSACDFITDRSPDDRPFAMVVGWILPHNPLVCEKDRFDHYFANIPSLEPEPDAYLTELHPALKIWRERRGVGTLSPGQCRRALAAYYGLVEETDTNVGRIVEAVRKSQAAENTVIIYVSDHGDMAHEHGMWWKSNFYEGSANVPGILSWPGHISEGATRDEIVSLIDIGPTILDLVGADPLPDVSGRSFSTLLQGNDALDWPNEIFCEYSGLLGDQPSCMVRSGRWKLNYYSEFDSCQLFDLEADPGDRNDLGTHPAHSDRVAELRARIDTRWSAERIKEGMTRQERARRVISDAGHPSHPHAIEAFQASEEGNEFDFDQLEEPPTPM
ncbi:MAG: hypothetical protein CME26_10620 [Gemmatimonadetes bacterium]|nr:hypothetical protein [Gemmatimonadota bacterium]